MQAPAERHVAWIALGSNLGDSAAILRSAAKTLDADRHSCVEAVSSIYRSVAMGPVEQADFLNAVLRLNTALTPSDLLALTQSLEQAHGRVREIRWGPRTLDLDLLLYDDKTIATSNLVVPHPQMTERNFVVVPLQELNPDLCLPDGQTIRHIAQALGNDGLERLSGFRF